MPVSPAVLVEIEAPATRYRMIVWKFGGDESTFKDAGFGTHDYIAGILLVPNPALLLDRTGGSGYYGVERAGFYRSGDLVCAWEWLLRNFNPEDGNLLLSLKQNKTRDWRVEEIKKLEEVKGT